MYTAADNLAWGINDQEITEKVSDYLRNHILLMDLEQQLVTQPEIIPALIGFSCDEGVRRNHGRVGAKEGPEMARNALSRLAWHNKDRFVIDAGNVTCEDENLEDAQSSYAGIIHKLLRYNYLPVGIGGGHEIAFASYKGIRQHIAKKNLGVINFDAHFDMRTTLEKLPNSGTSFYQIAEHCRNNTLKFNYLCLGIQNFSNSVELFTTAKDFAVEWEYAENIIRENLSPLKKHLDTFIKSNDHIYLSLCMDVFNVSQAPGVSAINPLGIYPEITLELLKYIFASGKVISMDIAELNPKYDQDNRTSKLVAAIIYNVLHWTADINK